MTGPEHYRKAEGLIANAWRKVGATDSDAYLHDAATRELLIATAQVHADLAKAAATIDATGYTGQDVRRGGAWDEVLS